MNEGVSFRSSGEDVMPMPEAFIPVLLVVLGLCFGSYVTMASYRLPLGMDTVRQRSHCPLCGSMLRVRDLLPVISWVFFRGKCSHCGGGIPFRYPLIELAQAALFLAAYGVYGLTLTGITLMAVSVVLLILFVADMEHYLLPDKAQIWLLPLGILWSYSLGREVVDVLVAVACGTFTGCFLYFGYARWRKIHMLGFGDVKFLALVGLFLELRDYPPFLFLAGILGIATALAWRLLGKGKVFPFGPALILALLIKLFDMRWYDSFWQWYLS